MPSTVRKWGNSLGIRLPKAVAEQADLTDGTDIEFAVDEGVLKIRPVRRAPRQTLADLLARAKGPSPHRGLDVDGPVGRELL